MGWLFTHTHQRTFVRQLAGLIGENNATWITIFRRHEPVQIVMNGTSEQAQQFEERLKAEMPQVTGGRDDWQIQLLGSEHKGPPGLLESSEFLTTHRSSVARGAIELTAAESQIVSDIGGANLCDGRILNEQELTSRYVS